MLFSIAVNYGFGLLIEKTNHPKISFVFGVIFNIIVLGIFKYFNFIVSNLAFFGVKIDAPEIALPIGISFYTFQALSYIADVYTKKAPAQKNFFGLLLYISMFPQLIAGPIVRYTAISSRINKRSVTASKMADGIYRFVIGLGKKVIFANQLSEITDKFLTGNIASVSVCGAWLGLIAFTLQIYFDFSAYSDMAIGMGKCIGFDFDENFNYPYISSSITEFWRRWHISLSSFFRDYVYIPLGGNRKHQMLNIFVVWLLTGLWHGASWNFVIWGLYFCVLLIFEKFVLCKFKLPRIILHIYSLFFIIFGWGIFKFEDITLFPRFAASLFGFAGGGFIDLIAKSTFTENIWILALAILFSMPVGRIFNNLFVNGIKNGNPLSFVGASAVRTLVAISILFVSTILLIGATNNPFLYLRF
jgi:alginate O-acetyltransferase complex protein AlgI